MGDIPIVRRGFTPFRASGPLFGEPTCIIAGLPIQSISPSLIVAIGSTSAIQQIGKSFWHPCDWRPTGGMRSELPEPMTSRRASLTLPLSTGSDWETRICARSSKKGGKKKKNSKLPNRKDEQKKQGNLHIQINRAPTNRQRGSSAEQKC